MKVMWTTDLGSLESNRRHTRRSEALAKYVRAEFGEESIAWYLAEARRDAKRPKASRASQGTLKRARALRVTP